MKGKKLTPEIASAFSDDLARRLREDFGPLFAEVRRGEPLNLEAQIKVLRSRYGVKSEEKARGFANFQIGVYNVTLGEKRALAVRNYLNQQGGIPLHAINTISYGESMPVADNTTPAGRSQNRRVVIRVLE